MKLDLHALLNPRTIAIVGASERSDFTDKVLRNNNSRGFSGKIYLVNPKRETVFGQRCYRSLEEVPEPVDVAALSIPAASILDVVRQGIACGVKHFVINAGKRRGQGTPERIESAL